MNAKKCDRCKKYYDEYAGIHKRSEEGTIFQNYEIPYNQINLILYLENEIYDGVPNKIFDLCPDCMVEFDKWINKKGE